MVVGTGFAVAGFGVVVDGNGFAVVVTGPKVIGSVLVVVGLVVVAEGSDDVKSSVSVVVIGFKGVVVSCGLLVDVVVVGGTIFTTHLICPTGQIF